MKMMKMMNGKATLWLPLAAALTAGFVACGGNTRPAPQPAANGAPHNSGTSSTVANAAAAPAQPDAALQVSLQQAALTADDLPGSWTSGLTMGDTPAGGGLITAEYTSLFSQQAAAGGASPSLLIALQGYADSKAASANFSSASGSMTIQAPGGAKTSFNTTSVKIGDATLTESSSSPGGDLYNVTWRRGRVTATVNLTLPAGSGAQGMNQAIAIARAQDAKLAAAGL